MTSAYSVRANTWRRFSRTDRLTVHSYLVDRNRQSHCYEQVPGFPPAPAV
jgi:hypothetical protein